MRIRFIVTGDLEKRAMVASVSRWFPPTTYEGEPIEWLPSRKVDAATTNRIVPGRQPGGAMRALANAMLVEATKGKDGEPADLIVVIDDVELHNLDQPDRVCATFRAAVEMEIDRRALASGAEERLREQLRRRCSFHLLCPMVESYLFGETAALVRAGCADGIEPKLVSADVEAFESCDEAWRPEWEAENAHKASLPVPMPWWREQCHAKHYLEHLVARNGGFYDETAGGVAAFEALDWPRVAARPPAIPFARALFEDIGEAIGAPAPFAPGGASSLTHPDRKTDRATLLLRNM